MKVSFDWQVGRGRSARQAGCGESYKLLAAEGREAKHKQMSTHAKSARKALPVEASKKGYKLDHVTMNCCNHPN